MFPSKPLVNWKMSALAFVPLGKSLRRACPDAVWETISVVLLENCCFSRKERRKMWFLITGPPSVRLNCCSVPAKLWPRVMELALR